MRGTVEAVDFYFTKVRADDGSLKLFNHQGGNAVVERLRKVGQKVDVSVASAWPLFGLEVATEAPEIRVPVRARQQAEPQTSPSVAVGATGSPSPASAAPTAKPRVPSRR